MSGEEPVGQPSECGWKVVAACERGFQHEADGKPCQDAFAVRHLARGWLIAAVCDGAGSAKYAEEGSRRISEATVAAIAARLSCSGDAAVASGTLQAVVSGAVESVHGDMVRYAAERGSEPGDFHATLVGVIATDAGGMLFHIGDGAGLATSSADFSRVIISRPENGEYANETYFVTQAEWRDHLRFTEISPEYDIVALMSDGVTALALTGKMDAAFLPFFQPVSNYLSTHSEADGEKALGATLRREQVRAITGDDKTFVWAVRLPR